MGRRRHRRQRPRQKRKPRQEREAAAEAALLAQPYVKRWTGDNFFRSPQWLGLRAAVFQKYGRVCMACHAQHHDTHVDHIKPRSKYPQLELLFSNLQVLCRLCNMAKSNKYEADFRGDPTPRIGI